MLFKGSQRKNILNINKRNITKLTNAVYPEYHWVVSFLVYAFHMFNVSFITIGVYIRFTLQVVCMGTEAGSPSTEQTTNSISNSHNFLCLGTQAIQS